MTPERKSAIESVLEMLREDIVADVKRRDGQPLTGENVGQALGEIAAQVDALAHICQALLADIVPMPEPAPFVVTEVHECPECKRNADSERRAAEVHS